MSMTPTERAALLASLREQDPEIFSEANQIAADRAYVERHGLYGLLVVAWNVLCPKEKFVGGWHLEEVCKHLLAAITRNMPNLLINVPPGSSKSLLTSILLPAYVWGPMGEPHRKWMFAAFSDGRALTDAIKSRDFIASDWFQKRWPVALDGVHKGSFFTTAAGGWRMSASITSREWTGNHPDYVVVDDPISAKDVIGKAAELKTLLTKCQEAWDGQLSSRGLNQNEKIQIVIMQRLHDTDLVGYLQEREQSGGPHFELLRLPMYYEAEWPCVTRLKDGSAFGGDKRTREGEPLCPARWGEEALRNLQFTQGNEWSAQYQQRPANKAGQIFQRSWFRFWTLDELRAKGANPLTGQGFEQLACSWDFTFKDTRGSDFVCGQVWGKLGPDFFLLERVYEKMNFPTSLTAIKAMIRRWPNLGAKLIEDKANGPAIISSLVTQVPGIVPVLPMGDKPSRAGAVSFLHRAGNVYYPPEYAHDKSDTSHVENMARFPLAKHDDSVDAETQMLSYWIANQNQMFAALAAQRREREAQERAQANARR